MLLPIGALKNVLKKIQIEMSKTMIPPQTPPPMLSLLLEIF